MWLTVRKKNQEITISCIHDTQILEHFVVAKWQRPRLSICIAVSYEDNVILINLCHLLFKINRGIFSASGFGFASGSSIWTKLLVIKKHLSAW